MTPDAPRNAGKHITSNVAGVRSQQYTKESGFWLAQMTLCVETLHHFMFPPFIRQINPGGTTYGLSLRQI